MSQSLPNDSRIPMQPNTQKLKFTALFGYFGLLAYLPAYLYWLNPSSLLSGHFLMVVYWLPLLFPFYGLVKGNPYTYAWANFILMILFLQAFASLWISPEAWLYTLIELILVTMMFIGCTYYARARGRELGAKIGKLKDDLAAEKAAHEAK